MIKLDTTLYIKQLQAQNKELQIALTQAREEIERFKEEKTFKPKRSEINDNRR